MPDAKYHQRREAQEREAAARAAEPAVREIHRQLADRHADAAWSIREGRSESRAVAG